MTYCKKKPYRHKGESVQTKRKYGSDQSMLRKDGSGKAQSSRYKDHIDGA